MKLSVRLLTMTFGLVLLLGSVPVNAEAAPARAPVGAAPRCAHRVRPHGTIRYSDWQFPDTLNPYQSVESVSGETTRSMFDPLFDYNNKVRLFGKLAAEVPTLRNGSIKNGGRTIVVHLKKGMRWSNGAEITAADVKFGWMVGMDKATGPHCSGTCDIIRTVDTRDRYTAVLHFKETYAPAIPNAMPDVWPRVWPDAWNGDPHAAALKLSQDPTFNFEGPNYPTDGPYQVSQFVRDDRIVLHPMPYYRTMTCGAAATNLLFVFYATKAGMIAAAASRQTDVTTNYTTADVPLLRSNRRAFTAYVQPGFAFEHLEFNTDVQYGGQPNPLNSRKVRLALALALDKLGLIQSGLGVSRAQAKQLVAWTPWVDVAGLVQPFTDKSINGQWDPVVKRFVSPGSGRALADARTLLRGTLCENGCTLDFFTTNGNPVRQAQEDVIASNWKRIGVDLSPHFVPLSVFLAGWDRGGIMVHGAFQVGMFAWGASPDPDYLKFMTQSRYIDREQTTHANLNRNYAGIHDQLIDRDFDRGAHSFNRVIRYRNYAAIQLELDKLAYWICLYFRPQINTSDPRVGNFKPGPLAASWWNTYEWKSQGS